MLSSRWNKVHVHGPTIWIDDGPVGVHGSSQANKEVDDPSPVRAISVPRRLAQRPPQQECAGPQNGCAGTALSTTRFAGEREEIGTRALAVNRVPRGAAGSSSGQSLSDPRKSGRDPHYDPADPGGRRGTFPKSRISIGYASSDIADGSVGAAESPSAPATGNSESEKGPSRYTADRGIGSVGTIPEVVDVRGSSADRIRFPSAFPGAYDLHRQVDGRLGSRIPRPVVARKVAACRLAHQLAGVEDGVDGHPTPTVPDQGPVRISAGGQHDSGGLSQKRRRDQVQIPVEIIEEDSAASTQSSDYTRAPPYHGPTQRTSGFGFKSGSSSTVGMGPDLRSVQLGGQAVSLGSPGGGSVRKRQQSQARDVHVTLPRRKGNRRGRSSLSVAGEDSIRLSSDVHPTRRAQQDAIRSPVQDSPGPSLAPLAKWIQTLNSLPRRSCASSLAGQCWFVSRIGITCIRIRKR